MAKIYVASSWRCLYQPRAVALLRAVGHEVYDFRNPEPGDHGFAWSEIDPRWLGWEPRKFRAALQHPVAIAGFEKDMRALRGCEMCLCVLPCNRSAHLELGWAVGAGKRTAIWMPEPSEPELMYRALGSILVSETEVTAWAKRMAL